MKVYIVKDQQEGAQKSFEIFKQAYENGAKVFGLATGSSPVGLYEKLRHSHLDFTNCISINLDEYVGLSKDNEHSYDYFMREHLFNAKPFKENHLPNGLGDSPVEEERYERILEKYPIDFQLLGIGSNAHIGFNEPGTPFTQRTHKVQLAQSTVEANKRFFDKIEDVPTHAYSMGLANIAQAKEILLVAYGLKKAQAIVDMVEGEVSPRVPASILQNHPNVSIIVDEAAASLLTKRD